MTTNLIDNDRTCPVGRALDVIGDRWSLLIVREAFDGVSRFGDFQRELGVARNILTDRLRKLVDAGILLSQPAADGSAYQAYVLTPSGENLFPIVVALRQWGEKHLFTRGEKYSRLIDIGTGRPVPLMTPRTSEGRPLSASETRVKKVV